MIHVVATIEVAEGRRDEFLAVQSHLLPLVRAEVGCVEYVPTIDTPLDPKMPVRADVVTMHEKWETLDNLKAHAVAPHMGDFRNKTKALVKNVKVDVFETI